MKHSKETTTTQAGKEYLEPVKWDVAYASNVDLSVRIKCGEKIIADCYSFSEGISDEQAEANAKLIAAAPEIAKALQDMIEKSNHLVNMDGLRNFKRADAIRKLNLSIDNAKSILNKAGL